MPAIAQKRRKKSTPKKAAVPPAERSVWVEYLVAALAGGALGLSAPGLNQWWVAWVGLAPLLLLAVSSPNNLTALLRGLAFGTAYNLVYLNWYIGLHPLNWLGFNHLESLAMALAAWLVVSLHQGLIVAVFALILKLLPTTGGFLPRRVEGRLRFPTLITIPILWVLVENKILNAPWLLGVPWSMLEYSQHGQLAVLQIASIVGGIGLGAMLVMANTALAGLFATLSRRLSLSPLAAPTPGVAARQTVTVGLILAVVYAWGVTTLSSTHLNPTVKVTVPQANINIDMQRSEHKFTLSELLKNHARMLSSSSGGLCIFTENSTPADLAREPEATAFLEGLAKRHKLDMVVGAIDRDEQDRPYNSAYGIAAAGKIMPSVYHKRYLVPFGEYTPTFAQYLPEWIRRLTNTPAGGGFQSGKEPVIMKLSAGEVTPTICFETISPELVAAGVRRGGQLVVNLTDLAWFHDSMVGDQMIAFSVLRAVENHRYLVFANNNGPSAVIAPTGEITASTPLEKESLLKGKVELRKELTPFTTLFR